MAGLRVQHVYLKDATVGDNMEGEVLESIIRGAGFDVAHGHEPMERVVCFGGGGMFYDRGHEDNWLEEKWIRVVESADRVAAFSIGVQSPLNPKYYGRIISRCEVITVRNYVSMGRIMGMVSGDAWIMPPLGFLYPFDEYASAKRDIDIGVAINCQEMPNARREEVMKNKPWAMQRIVLEHLPDDAVIIPCAEPYEEYDVWNTKKLDILHNRGMRPDVFVEHVSRCRVLICGRYHGLITAMMTGTPAIIVGESIQTGLGKVGILAVTAGLKKIYHVRAFVSNMDEIIRSVMDDWKSMSNYMMKAGKVLRRQALFHGRLVEKWLNSCRRSS